MIRMLLSRVLQSLLVLLIVYAGSFFLLMQKPGSPFAGEKALRPEVEKALNEKFGLDQGQWHAFMFYTDRLLRHGDLGPTITYRDQSVNQIIAKSLPVSTCLGCVTLIIALWGGVAAGTWGAVKRGQTPDLLLSILTLFGISLPTFTIGSILLLIVAAYLPILPTVGWGHLSQLILPSITLALSYLAVIARLTRASALDVISADYVRAARAKGLSVPRVIVGHVLPNATLPVLSLLGPAAASVLTGSFVVEKIFAIPGLGAHFVNACLNSDIPLVLGSVLVYTTLVVLFNLIVDIAYLFADPRIAWR